MRFRNPPKKPSQGRNSLDNAFYGLHDLFTRDVTRQGLSEMIGRDWHDTFRYFTRDINFKELAKLPWYERFLRIAWAVFTSLAFRLSPPRRIAFALAIFSFLIGSIRIAGWHPTVTKTGKMILSWNDGPAWWLFSILILIFLLLLELRDKLDLKSDLTVAREIQFGMVPSKPWEQDDFHIHYRMSTANTVGGDYYDLICLENGHVALLIGDVAGKGMPAALLMALLQGSIRTLLTAGDRGVSLFTKLNRYLSEATPENRLITLFYGELDLNSGELSYINAGHNPPLLWRSHGAVEWLPATSLVLAVMRDIPFVESKIHLNPGDQLLLYTDGITEAFNEKEEEFGEQRLVEFFRRFTDESQEEMLDQLLKEVRKFCHHVRPTDDMTLMSVRRNYSVGQKGAEAHAAEE